MAGLLATSLSAQNPNGTLRGEVEDPSGARIAGASITVQSVASSLKRHVIANARGEFRIEGLLPGRYKVVVTATGFADATSDVGIAVSLVRDVSVTLKPQSGRENVTVQGRASSITTEQLDTASAVHQGVIASNDLETLPLAARTFANIAYLVPGTEPVEPSDPRRPASPPFRRAEVRDLITSFRSMAPTTPTTGSEASCKTFLPTAIQEFDVRTANEDADTG